ncbi:MAG TPA: hypothetical protein VEK76_07660 [Candidatus Binatia bacterium]|nr:hypothetical protein [Candidatus Binatia bacterium]
MPMGPPWTRADYLLLSGCAAVVVVVIGLILGALTGGSTTVQTPSSTTSFKVPSGDSGAFIPGEPVSVGGQQDTILYIFNNQITLATALSSAPAAGTSVTQSLLLPGVANLTATVASKPAPTTTKFTVTSPGDDAGYFGGQVTVGGQAATVQAQSSPAPSQQIVVSTLPAAPSAGAGVSGTLLYPGSLLDGVGGLATGTLAIITLPLSLFVVRPLVVRLRRKGRPRVTEIIFFGLAIWLVDALVYSLLQALGATSGVGVYVISVVLAILSGFVIVPTIFPFLARMLRPRPRPTPAGGGGRR